MSMISTGSSVGPAAASSWILHPGFAFATARAATAAPSPPTEQPAGAGARHRMGNGRSQRAGLMREGVDRSAGGLESADPRTREVLRRIVAFRASGSRPLDLPRPAARMRLLVARAARFR